MILRRLTLQATESLSEPTTLKAAGSGQNEHGIAEGVEAVALELRVRIDPLQPIKSDERTDKREPAIYDFLKKRVFYRITAKGKAETTAWEDPVRAVHPEFG